MTDSKRIEFLLEQCVSGDYDAQIDAIYELRDAKVSSAVPIIADLIGSPDPGVRGAVAEVMGDLAIPHAESVGPKLMELLSDPDDLTRADAAESLGRLHYTPAREQVEKLLINDPEWHVRTSMAQTLADIGDERSIQALKEALSNDPEDVVRGWAAHCIGLFAGPEVLPVLAQHLDTDPDDELKADLLCAGYRLGERGYLKLLSSLVEATDEIVTLKIVNRFWNLVKVKNPPTLIEDASEIKRMLRIAVERFPVLEPDIDGITRTLSILSGEAKA